MDARSDAELVTGFADGFDGFDQARVFKLTGDAERDGEVSGSNENRVDAGHGKDFGAGFDGAGRFDLEHSQNVGVGVGNDFVERRGLVADLAGLEAVAADAEGREEGPRDGGFEEAGIPCGGR